ncbi:MAG: tryptophan synthase subunit alpha [Gammaproteobacteria bacterium]|nr:tryptophan synthase subunit alpha [Gammaproteobacteria bacterium]NIR83089.1 tryptophan synthase subunit alpha [Gammaproteobacteria bacterium]NIR90751.1 tryptophan synthase subunit alpha [Gammaproteobacteria bacterium]NIU04242.1 tryptophan synthase subunit alpha [Gammaproteobacteria bacterium]NIV51534.1 tryptophan synthase subunit alpha [Gammaproteobacteria bacterium]
MSRIAQRFATLRADGRRALVSFVTAGDPSPEVTVPLLHALVEAGADLVELGVPFSDPMADGPVIQRASERALRHHVSLRRVLAMVQEFRREDTQTPLVLMGYLNPFESVGYDAFAAAAREAGVDGVLTVDLPPEEAAEFAQALRANGLDPIFLVAPTTEAQRIGRICKQASGFVYYVSLKGVTGAATLDVETVGERVAAIKAVTDLPVGVGFGIRDAESAARVATVSDAVVVGSALVQRIEALVERPDAIPVEVPAILGEMRAAMDDATAASGARTAARAQPQ